MKFIKKILVASVSLTLSLSLCSGNVFAFENAIYEETGQIELKNLHFSVKDSNLQISTKSRSISLEDRTAINKIEENEIIQEGIKKNIIDNSVPIAIGYTTIYLKDIVQEDGTITQIPMTNLEVQKQKMSRVSYSPTKAFQIFTFGSIASNGTITATSAADYTKTGWLGQDEIPQPAKYDYIGLAMPKEYTLTNEKLDNSKINYYFADMTDNATVMGVMLRPSPSVAPIKSIWMSGKGLKNSNVTNKKVISHYVHNWNTAKLSVSLNATGTSISLSTENKTWKVYSSVIL